jgi:hypothetical protein
MQNDAIPNIRNKKNTVRGIQVVGRWRHDENKSLPTEFSFDIVSQLVFVREPAIVPYTVAQAASSNVIVATASK